MSLILIVEDEISVLRVTSEDIQRAFDSDVVRMATSVEGAVNIARQAIDKGERIEVAIVDLRLPSKGEMHIDGGFEVAKQIRDLHPEAALIVHTVRDDEVALKVIAQNNYHYVPKYTSSKELVAQVRKNREAKKAGQR